MDFSSIVTMIADNIWGLPLLVAIFALSVFVTLRLRFVQFRYFFTSISMLFSSSDSAATSAKKTDDLTAFQAFINTLGANIGNGSLGGIPIALCVGGPGSIFWLLVVSTFAISLRYAEVFLGMVFIGKHRFGSAKGGPMLYLSLLPGGFVLSYAFAIFCLGYAFFAGNAVQCNTVGLALQKTWGIDPYVTAFFVLAFILYILIGGAQRIVKYLDMLVPFKVLLFVGSSLIVLLYNYQAVPHAFYLIWQGAFNPQAFLGGTFGYAMQTAMTVGLQRGILIHEAGLGTAAVAFGSTTGEHAVKDSLMSMLSVYINTHVICLMIALSILSSGVFGNGSGDTSSALMVAAYETVFGSFGGWIISFLAINFGISVLVSYAYLGRVCWNFLTGGKFMYAFPILYATAAFFGTYMNVAIVWKLADIVNAGLVVCNLLGLVWFIAVIVKGLKNYEGQRE
ncbi:sodium:alanine symporter family protein [Candidatus Babeliales bacterium]|nr:sodium:alanine symporter family protein [Candidatus Babeliales bacterium]MBP9844309.1 sodium:alanine symporter family protein [Candidatus Babeliales bacterium]